MQTALLVLLGLLVAYLLFVYWVIRTGRLERWNLSLMLGIVLMVRTQKGKLLIDAIARPRRLWNAIGDLGIVLTLAGMLLMTVFFFWSVWIVLQPDSGVEPLGVSEILVIPGVNPYVPLWYGLAALAFTLVVHEGGHGVLARANQMKLKSLGLLVAVVPIGAFVEPDDLDMKVASRRARLRVFGAGPAVNLGFAAATLAAFSLMVSAATLDPGLHVTAIIKDGPAERAGIPPAVTVASINGTAMGSWTDFRAFMETAKPGQTVHVVLDDARSYNVTLANRWTSLASDQEREDVLQATAHGRKVCDDLLGPGVANGSACANLLMQRTFIGMSALTENGLEVLERPFGNHGLNMLSLIALPLAEVKGDSPVLNSYLPAFYSTPFAEPAYWMLASLLFWLFWINLMVGLTNILPMLPLDGGHIFRDVVGGTVQRLRPSLSNERREKVVSVAAAAMSLLILTAFVVQIVGPHILKSLR